MIKHTGVASGLIAGSRCPNSSKSTAPQLVVLVLVQSALFFRYTYDDRNSASDRMY
jgi:hypothetical protein